MRAQQGICGQARGVESDHKGWSTTKRDAEVKFAAGGSHRARSTRKLDWPYSERLNKQKNPT